MLEEYKQWVNLRKNSVTPFVRKRLHQLLLLNPDVEKVWLSGSYVKGDWVDENTPDEFKKIRNKLKNKSTLSDVDFITYPIIQGNNYYDIISDNKHKLLLYDNTKEKI